MSIAETKRFITSGNLRQCQPTKYAMELGAYQISKNGTISWWLRTPGNDARHATYVDINGSINENGYLVRNDVYFVRPAMWIDISQ